MKAFATSLLLLLGGAAALKIMQPFHAGKAFKVISGLHRFDEPLVRAVATAGERGGATCIDIACCPDLVKASLSAAPSLPVVVSAVDPSLFAPALAAGASMLEIGNFDGFYDQGLTFTAADVEAMAADTLRLHPDVPVSVTVPHTLPLDEQVALALRLEALGAALIQTEGAPQRAGLEGGVEEIIARAVPTLAATHAISRAVSVPVMSASHITDVTAPLALAAGARGVGVGSFVNRLPSQQHMTWAVEGIARALELPPVAPAAPSALADAPKGADAQA